MSEMTLPSKHMLLTGFVRCKHLFRLKFECTNKKADCGSELGQCLLLKNECNFIYYYCIIVTKTIPFSSKQIIITEWIKWNIIIISLIITLYMKNLQFWNPENSRFFVVSPCITCYIYIKLVIHVIMFLDLFHSISTGVRAGVCAYMRASVYIHK